MQPTSVRFGKLQECARVISYPAACRRVSTDTARPLFPFTGLNEGDYISFAGAMRSPI